jgi:type IV pilus assembly protein PilY1
MTAHTRYPTRGGAVPGSVEVVNIVPSRTSYPHPEDSQRTDCNATRVCTYAEEMTNFANWWTYYRTRIQTMKTSTSLVFSKIDDTYRVGYNVINNASLVESASSASFPEANKFLHIRAFDQNQKNAFYDRLFSGRPALNQSWQGEIYTDTYNHTPLRAALSHAGRYYAKKLSGQTYDPIEYACQANFTVLSTDGSWNTDDENDSFGPKDLNGVNVGNQDAGALVPRPKREHPTDTYPNSLADITMYYANTDLRRSDLGNCLGSVGYLCESETDKQNMTTFTVGLGINGTLIYQGDYQTATSGDFYEITTGTKNWPRNCPSDYCPERVDDLWHAAVNGNGRYFSAQDPQQLKDGLSAALEEIYNRATTGAAPATSTLRPVAANNSAYVTSYTAMEWTGNLESREINPSTGQISQAASWCVEDAAALVTAADGSESLVSCQGKLKLKFPAGGGDTRKIYTNGIGGRVLFTYANLTPGQKPYFESPHWIANGGLTQWPSLTEAQKRSAEKDTLVNYLRGRATHEDKTTNTTIDNRLFRGRVKTLGDISESAAVFVGAPNFNYLESSYGSFKTAQANRASSVYVGANDGMLHAFNADDGTERWAYIPSMVLPNLWKLADKKYAAKHQNFVNGSITVSDICSNPCSTASDWKTILVGGLNQGGKGFYALNVTSANDKPDLLWEFDINDNGDLGYSFGNPVITKLRNGTWVVLLTSGYNNTGVGHLYVLDAISGTLIRKISTDVGDAINPSGLAKISAFVARPSENNQADYVYGGDLLGNLWRFKIDSEGSVSNPKNPLLLANLKDEFGVIQPITARPELGKFGGQTMVFIGTGKYLEKIDLKTTQPQTLYAIKDNGSSILRSDLSRRSISNPTSGNSRIGSKQNEDGKPGWYIDLPDSGERQVVSAKLASGTLVVPTMVPSTQACGSNGYGWINYFEARTGGIVSTTIANRVGTKTAAAPVGINLLYIDGKPILNFTSDNDPTPQLDPNAPFKTGGGFAGKRASWRELIR